MMETVVAVVALKVVIALNVNSPVPVHVIRNVKGSALHRVVHLAKVEVARVIPVNPRVWAIAVPLAWEGAVHLVRGHVTLFVQVQPKAVLPDAIIVVQVLVAALVRALHLVEVVDAEAVVKDRVMILVLDHVMRIAQTSVLVAVVSHVLVIVIGHVVVSHIQFK